MTSTYPISPCTSGQVLGRDRHHLHKCLSTMSCGLPRFLRRTGMTLQIYKNITKQPIPYLSFIHFSMRPVYSERENPKNPERRAVSHGML